MLQLKQHTPIAPKMEDMLPSDIITFYNTSLHEQFSDVKSSNLRLTMIDDLVYTETSQRRLLVNYYILRI